MFSVSFFISYVIDLAISERLSCPDSIPFSKNSYYNNTKI